MACEHQREVKIFGAMTGELCCTISVQSSSNIQRLKTQIMNTEGTPVPDQKLLFNGRAFYDHAVIGKIFEVQQHTIVTLLRVPPKPVPAHPSVEVVNCEGSSSVRWIVDGRKMRKQSNGQLVSPAFALNFGDKRNRPCRIVLHGNGRISRKSPRAGKLQLKCDESIPEKLPKVSLTVEIDFGDQQRVSCGHFQHDFGQLSSCLLPQYEDVFDFDVALEKSSAFAVCVRVSH